MNLHIEQEAKILAIEKKSVERALWKIGARKILNAVTVIETYDKTPGPLTKIHTPAKDGRFTPVFQKIEELTKNGRTLLSQGAYLRIRKEGRRTEIILKRRTGTEHAHVKSEYETSIPIRTDTEKRTIQNLLIRKGFKKIFHQEKKRVSYVYDLLGLRFDIDTWPGVPTYVEIEGPNRNAIEKGARLIGFRAHDLTGEGAKEIFQKYSVSPIYLTFAQTNRRVNSAQLLQIMKKAVRERGVSEADADYIARHYWEAELMGKQYHGIRKFCWDIQYYGEAQGKPKIETNRRGTALVNGHREIGPLAARFCVKLALAKARHYGIALIGLKNFQRYGVLSTWAKEIARAGFIGIVSNISEEFVIPPNGKGAVLGTNPISMSAPKTPKPIVLDMSTSKTPMSTVWYERMRSGTLPENTFVDSTGAFTTNPWQAQWVEAWGGRKGFNLSFMLQLLSGPMLGLRTGSINQNPYQVGAVFIAINPKMFGSLVSFGKNVAKLETITKHHGGIIPGEHSRRQEESAKKSGHVTLPGQVWGWLNLL